MPTFEHKGLGVSATVPDDLRYRDVEAFFKARRELGGDESISSPEYCGTIVRAAARLGWIEGVDENGVGELKGGAVIWLSGKIQGEVTGAMAVPPE